VLDENGDATTYDYKLAPDSTVFVGGPIMEHRRDEPVKQDTSLLWEK
jgi:hypothetical protein